MQNWLSLGLFCVYVWNLDWRHQRKFFVPTTCNFGPKFPTFFSLKIETVDDLGVKTVRICHAKWLLFPEEENIENEICTYESSRKFVDILSILSIWCIFWQHNFPSCISFILRIKTFCSGYFIKDIFGSEITQCQSILNDTLRNLTRNWHTK